VDQVLQDFIAALRNSGVRISVAENMDALHAAAFMGCADRQDLKDSLSATLAKSQYEKEIFDSCFDRFFCTESPSHPEKDSHGEPEMDTGGQDSSLTEMLLSGDNVGLSIAMRQAARQANINEIQFFTQKSLYTRRILQGMGMEAVEGDIRRLSGEGMGTSLQKAKALKDARDALMQNVRNFVEQQYPLFAGAATEEIMERYLKDMRLSNLEQRDFQRMHRIVQKMVKRLNDRHSKRKKAEKRGCFDLKRTLRANVAYQGMIIDPRWKSKKIDRADIVALCDVSRSVEDFVRFMLLFFYNLNEAVVRIRSYIFCSNLVDVTHVFEEHPVEEALVRLQRGVGLGIRFGGTDYGQALRDFKENWMDRVTNRTTVIILGDARNNFGDPEMGILRLLQERSKRIIWLNPEPPTFWGTGDSEMKRYMAYCTLSRECSTVNHLQRVVDYLLRTR